MQDSDRFLPLPVCIERLRLSSRGDVIAVVCALTAFPVAFWLSDGPVRAVSLDLAANLTLLAVCPAAVSLAASRAAWGAVPEELVLPAATRFGLRLGVLVFFVAGGAFLLGDLANPPMRRSPLFPSLPALPANGAAGVIFSMLPTIAAGALTAVARAGRGAAAADGPLHGGDGTVSRTRGKLPIAAAFFFLLGLLSPAMRPLVHREHRPAAASASQAPFRYETPAGFGDLPAAGVAIVGSGWLPNLTGRSVAAFSPDSTHLAFSDCVNGHPVIFNLRQNRADRTFDALGDARGLAWSPDGSRVFFLGAGGTCAVLDVAKGSVVNLPVRLPFEDGQPRWDRETEVAFGHGTLMLGKLDLDTLRFERSEASAAGPPGNPVSASRLGEAGRWRLEIRPMVRRLGAPDDERNGRDFTVSPGLFAVDKGDGSVFCLRGLEANPLLLASPDCTTVIEVRPGGSVTHYLGPIGTPRQKHFASAFPPLPAIEPGSELEGLAKAGQLAVFVCAPFVNPLNGKVVGPDPRAVRALAAIPSRSSSDGELVVVESYSPVQPGDVAGYLHYWRSGQPVLLESKALRSWAGAVTPRDGSEAPPAARSQRWRGADPVESGAGTEFAGWHGLELPVGLQVAEVSALNAAPKTADREVEIAAPKPAGPLPSKPEPDSRAGRKALPTDGQASRRVRAFVAEHHAKVGRLDLEGFVGDYAGTVEFTGKGRVTPDFVRRDQAAYLERYENHSETLVGEVAVTRGDHGGWRAAYTIRSIARKKADGKKFDHRVSIVLDLLPAPDGSLTIVRETASVLK